MLRSALRDSIEEKDEFDFSEIKPYGDTFNDGKIQVSFTLPIEHNEKAIEAAKLLMLKMGISEPSIVYHCKLDNNFTFFNAYGNITHSIDYTDIEVEALNTKIMTLKETNDYIKKNIKRKIVVVGATTGTDAHTVGLDAIMNMKGCAGHYGLERYKMFKTFNLGSQVLNEDFVQKALELDADALLISQTVTQKDIHVRNLMELVEILKNRGLRNKFLLICGGARITHDFAKKLGYDAGFGAGKYADDVASFIANEIYLRIKKE